MLYILTIIIITFECLYRQHILAHFQENLWKDLLSYKKEDWHETLYVLYKLKIIEY